MFAHHVLLGRQQTVRVVRLPPVRIRMENRHRQRPVDLRRVSVQGLFPNRGVVRGWERRRALVGAQTLGAIAELQPQFVPGCVNREGRVEHPDCGGLSRVSDEVFAQVCEEGHVGGRVLDGRTVELEDETLGLKGLGVGLAPVHDRVQN